MSSHPLALPDTLFDIESFAAWSRALYRMMPLPGHVRTLFESTIEEPTDQLATVVRDVFTTPVSDRFESVFGRGNAYVIAALSQRYGVNEDQIVCTTGASTAVGMVLHTLVEPGDHVLVETPRFDVLDSLSRDRGARVDTLTRNGAGMKIDPDHLADKLQPDTRLVLISNLHNPSGYLMREAELAELAAVAERNGTLILVDEVYGDFAGESGETCAARVAPNVITVNSLTKVFGLFALRCGWIVCDPALARRISRDNADREFGVSKLTHAVAAHVLERPEPFDSHWRTILNATRPVLERHFNAMRDDGLIDGILPDYGCICFPEILGVTDTRALARDMWKQQGLVLAPGEFFGQPGHIRLGFGVAPDRLDEGLARLHEALYARRRAVRSA